MLYFHIITVKYIEKLEHVLIGKVHGCISGSEDRKLPNVTNIFLINTMHE